MKGLKNAIGLSVANLIAALRPNALVIDPDRRVRPNALAIDPDRRVRFELELENEQLRNELDELGAELERARVGLYNSALNAAMQQALGPLYNAQHAAAQLHNALAHCTPGRSLFFGALGD